MGAGKDFEDALMDSLEAWVGDDGVPMLRKQQMATRRGKFQMGQEVDIMVDSPHDEYYIGIEAKSRDASSSKGQYGFYLSGLNTDQFRDQVSYAEKSGRDVFVACEARNWHRDRDYAYIVPLELFILRDDRNDTKVSWDDIAHFGEFIGRDGEYVVTREVIDAALETGEELADDPDQLDETIEVPEEIVVNADTPISNGRSQSGEWSVR